jgi:outer membrane protein insertion porin family
LYETNFFQDVSIKFENDILEIVVIENPIIEDIEIRGISHEPTIKNILSSISLKIRSSYNESYLNNDLILIKNLLKKKWLLFLKS